MNGSPALYTARALVDELLRGGVRRFAVAPGSRSTPLALAVAERRDAIAHVFTDERSLAFFALGASRGEGRPVAVVCTSGTAAANLLPAVAESMLGGGALVLLTADRPPELRDAASPQTIDQVGLFGAHARWSVDVPLLDPSIGAARVLRSLASRATATASRGRGGPVHLNVPLREPFRDDSFPLASPFDVAGREGAQPFTVCREPDRLGDGEVAALAAVLAAAERGVLVCSGPALPADDLARLAAALGWPLIADPLCGLRFGPHDRSLVVDAAEPLLRDADLAARWKPDAIVRFGLTPAPRSVQRWLDESWPAEHVVVCDSGHDDWPDPMRAASRLVRSDAGALCRALVAAVRGTSVDPAWTAGWITASRAARSALDSALDAEPLLFAGAVLRCLARILPEDAALAIGNSMPVRDADAFVGATAKRLRPFASRGASGIDGLVSTAIGLATSDPRPTALVLGDLSFLHDAGALAFATRERTPLLVVVVNNDGGGIFSHLPLRDALVAEGEGDVFERFFGTPHGSDLGAIAVAAGARFLRVNARTALDETLTAGLAASADGPVVVEVRTDRDAARAAHLAAVRAGQLAAREATAATHDATAQTPPRKSLADESPAAQPPTRRTV
jgi:2-succinyl-5-enolpyruvyl-6-hydroxy-3-cyclohexene-1-carboxylate synthase